MKIRMNLKGNFKLVPEGQRVLEITKAECTPSGKPNKMKVTFQDTEGGFINTQYNFDNSTSVWVMGKMLEIAIGMEDGDEFDTKTDTPKLIGKKLLCEVKHTKGTKLNEETGEYPTFANISKTISLVTDDGEVVDTEKSPRNAIADDDEDDLD